MGKTIRSGILYWIFLVVIVGLLTGCADTRPEKRILVFSKTAAFRHVDAIPAGIAALQKLGEEQGIAIDTTENAAYFHPDSLDRYSAVIFLCTTGDVLDSRQQADFERYIQGGGGYVGIHSASDTEYDWPWYGKLVGAYFEGHPAIQPATLNVVDKEHPSTVHLGDTWERTDEWYNFRPESVNPDVHVLIEIDESSYEGGTMGEHHPMSWYHDYDGGRVFYTAMGHVTETYQEEKFLQHLLAGIEYAIGPNSYPDYAKAASYRVPDSDRFTRVVLEEVLNEPMELEVLPNGNVLFIERHGAIKLFEARSGQTRTIATLPVYSKLEDGLLGLALDPNFSTNGFIYLFYSPRGDKSVQHVSRFLYDEGTLVLDSEKVILEIPVQRDECCHAGGSLEFDSKGNLYASVGDNTNPFFSSGYAPIDERPGRKYFDAQRSAANPNDLRGKILRIHPEADGSYTIPDGNLFPKDGSQGRPEIYIMGCRNPFRISIDPETDFLYWGDVGPDASVDSLGRGPRGHDEINQARAPGFFGWPLFIADNKSYNDFDFATGRAGSLFDPVSPINASPNNSGQRELPPAQPAFIWYPYGESLEFPWLKSGGRTAMAGPFYQGPENSGSNVAFPDYFRGKLLMYDWIRGWMFLVHMDEEGDYLQMDPFMPELDLHNAIDMDYGPDGALYMLEYGVTWNQRNTDARLSRIEFNAGNRLPNVKIAADNIQGSVPLTVNFSAAGSSDPDGDELSYRWHFEGNQVQSDEREPSFTFRNAGIYRVELEVLDNNGGSSRAFVDVLAGNEPPDVRWVTDANRSFYWSYQPITYEVVVTDKEDGEVDPRHVRITYEYDPLGKAVSDPGEAEIAYDARLAAEGLLTTYNCVSCHRIEGESQGPEYISVAKKYAGESGADQYLVRKIQNGGSGVWGEAAMPAHPNLSDVDAEAIVQFILSLDEPEIESNPLPIKGAIRLRTHVWTETRGVYKLVATYTDFGNGNIRPIAASSTIVLRHPRVEAESYAEASAGIQRRSADDIVLVSGFKNDSYLYFGNLDLTGISRIRLGAVGPGSGLVELHLDGLNTPTVASASLAEVETTTMSLSGLSGFHDIYLVFRDVGTTSVSDLRLDYLEFVR